jgi:hypothetical protein
VLGSGRLVALDSNNHILQVQAAFAVFIDEVERFVARGSAGEYGLVRDTRARETAPWPTARTSSSSGATTSGSPTCRATRTG